MAEGRREPPSPPTSEVSGGVHPAGGGDRAEQERHGPLAVDRHRKADGRELILYTLLADVGEPRG